CWVDPPLDATHRRPPGRLRRRRHARRARRRLLPALPRRDRPGHARHPGRVVLLPALPAHGRPLARGLLLLRAVPGPAQPFARRGGPVRLRGDGPGAAPPRGPRDVLPRLLVLAPGPPLLLLPRRALRLRRTDGDPPVPRGGLAARGQRPPRPRRRRRPPRPRARRQVPGAPRGGPARRGLRRRRAGKAELGPPRRAPAPDD